MSAAAALTGIMMGSGIPKQDYTPTLKQKVFARFFENIGMGDHSAIINIIVTKVTIEFCRMRNISVSNFEYVTVSKKCIKKFVVAAFEVDHEKLLYRGILRRVGYARKGCTFPKGVFTLV